MSEKDRLAALRYDDGSRQDAPSVAAAFELSYRRLNETSTRVFRLLPVNPGPDISTAAAAVLADLSGWCLEGFLCQCPVSGSSDQGPRPAVCQGLAGGAMSSSWFARAVR